MEKINFKITDKDYLNKHYPFHKCDIHPDSQFLEIKYEKNSSILWCLDCLWKALKEDTKGQWNVEDFEEKS